MQSTHSNLINEQLELLRIAVQAGKLSQTDIASATGIHQSQVSRILSGQGKLASKNTLKLCKFSSDLHRTGSVTRQMDQRLITAIFKIWDGSFEHATAIEKIILSLNGMTVKRTST
ncbi:MAG: helix-turn-helix transcriptional regulator [Gallionella sp.]